MSREKYIDSIKGFAIFLMVMGHVLAWMFHDYHAISTTPSPSLLWVIIYSFHMPLFIFVSGFLFAKKNFDTIDKYIFYTLKKVKTILIPYFSCGFLLYLWRGGHHFEYWYLLTLFLLIVIVGIGNYCSLYIFVNHDKISQAKCLIFEFIYLLTVFIVMLFLSHYANSHPRLFFSFNRWFPHLTYMYPYFSLGYLIHRYHNNIEKKIPKSELVYFVCFIYFVLCQYTHIKNNYPGFSLTALSAIYCIFYLFKEKLTKGCIIEYLQRLGRQSLYIYILHFFFTLKLFFIGDYSQKISIENKANFASVFTLQLLYSIILSIIIIELSLFTAKIVKCNKYLALLILGE